jgi:hypothetical protein
MNRQYYEQSAKSPVTMYRMSQKHTKELMKERIPKTLGQGRVW